MTTELEFAGNKLRPEAVEALWHMWLLTGDRQYREWGWQIFQAFQEHSRGLVGYHNIKVSLSDTARLATPAAFKDDFNLQCCCSGRHHGTAEG